MKMSFFDKIEDVTIVDMFEQVFQWQNSRQERIAHNVIHKIIV